MRVVGIRGELVGYVVNVAEGSFKVDREERGEPIWLSQDAVIGVDGGRVELICADSEVGRYALDHDST